MRKLSITSRRGVLSPLMSFHLRGRVMLRPFPRAGPTEGRVLHAPRARPQTPRRPHPTDAFVAVLRPKGGYRFGVLDCPDPRPAPPHDPGRPTRLPPHPRNPA